MSSTSSASVEVMMRGLPRSNTLGMAASEPTARIACSNSMNCCPCSVSTRSSLRAFKITASLNHLHAAHLGQRGDAAAELLQNGFLPRAQFRQIHRRRRERDAAMRGFAARGDLVRRVKQRLRRNAAAIQANAAEPLLAFDENDFLAEVGRVKRRRVSARPGADHDDFSFDWVHDNTL